MTLNKGSDQNVKAYISSDTQDNDDDVFETPKLIQSSKKIQGQFRKSCAKIAYAETNKIMKINDEEWKQIFDVAKNKFISSYYMDVFRKKFREHFSCIINVKDSKITTTSRIIYTRKCKQPDCKREYCFTNKMNEDSQEYKKFSISYRGGEIIHTKELTNPLKGKAREMLKEKLKFQYGNDMQMVLMKDCDLELKKSGNLGDFKSIAVLNQARSEALKSQDIHADDVEDLKQRKMNEKKDGIVTLHNLTVADPFIVHVFTIDQLNLINMLKKNESKLRISIDATGNIARKPKGRQIFINSYHNKRTFNMTIFDQPIFFILILQSLNFTIPKISLQELKMIYYTMQACSM